MLPELILDNDTFESLIEEYRSRIAGIYPEWTDYNYHDPGITMLEMFAFLRENQQYFMEQLGAEHYRGFFRLGGIKPGDRKAAYVLGEAVRRNREADLFIPAGTGFLSGDLPFETVEDETIPAAEIVRAERLDRDGKRQYFVETGQLPYHGEISLLPFGSGPSDGMTMNLVLSGKLREGKTYHLSVLLGESGRNPFREDTFTPLVDLSWEYRTAAGWMPLTIIADETRGLLYSGRIAFRPERGDMAEARDGSLRVVFRGGEYDEPPVIRGISLGHIGLLQTGTRHFPQGIPVGEGNGFPGQEYPLPSPFFLKDSIRVLADDIQNPGRLVPWEATDDLLACGPEDRCFFPDERKGTIRFGDGFHGLPPEGRILITEISETAGASGNIKSDAVIKAADPAAAYGREEFRMKRIVVPGSDPETTEETLLRMIKEQHRITRAVTLADYERLTLDTPGLCIHSCHAYTSADQPKTVHIVVRPGGPDRTLPLSARFRENILSGLEEKRLLGNRIMLHSPEYIRVNVILEIVPAPQYRNADAIIEEEILAWFDEKDEIYGKMLEFGELFGRLDALPCIRRIQMLLLEPARAGVRRNKNGDLIPPVNGVFLAGTIDTVMNHYHTGRV